MKLKDQLIPLVGFLLILTTSFVFNCIQDQTTYGELALLALFSILLYSLLLTLYTWFYSKPYLTFEKQKNEYEKLHLKIKATVDKLIHKQRFIDQNILSIIEGEAQNIWVITTKLANELNDISLQNAVRKNLAQGKHYTYFLPHPENLHFAYVKRNLENFKKLDIYKQYKSQIEIIHLPLDTQFLLEEVVIYNPEQEENRNEETKGINGFTYYESKDEEIDTLHMKIEGFLLTFLRDRLYEYLSNYGLKYAVQRILTEFAKFISDSDKLFLANLLPQRKIIKSDYNNFIESLNSNPLSKNIAKDIHEILNNYIKAM